MDMFACRVVEYGLTSQQTHYRSYNVTVRETHCQTVLTDTAPELSFRAIPRPRHCATDTVPQSNSVYSVFNLSRLAAIQWLTWFKQVSNRSDSSSCIVATTVQIQLSVVGVGMHVHLVLLHFVSKVHHVENKNMWTQYRPLWYRAHNVNSEGCLIAVKHTKRPAGKVGAKPILPVCHGNSRRSN